MQDADQKLRHKWPLSAREDTGFGDFHCYLTSIKSLDESTSSTNVKKMQHFYGLRMISNGEEFMSHIGFFAGLYTTGVAGQLVKLPIMQPQLSSTRNLMVAVAHFTDYLLLTCGQKKFKEAARILTQLKGEIFDPLKQRANQEKDSFSEKRNDLDAVPLER